MLGPEVVQQTMKKVKFIQDKIMVAQSRQNSHLPSSLTSYSFKFAQCLSFVSTLKYVFNPFHVIELNYVQGRNNFLVKVVNQRIKQLRGNKISLVKIIWEGTFEGGTM
ncbi:hypothetical protein CR513_59710, partial [Mucuna pruriens]